MADLSDLNSAIVDAVRDAGHEPYGSDDVLACLIAGLGLAIAFRTQGRPVVAGALCEMVGVQVFEQATSVARMFESERGAA